MQPRRPGEGVRRRARRGAAAVLACCGIVTGALAAGATPAHAAFGAEGINQIAVDLTAQADGNLAVVETIDYDFGTVPHHGIIRVIPDRSRLDKHHDRIWPIHVTSVTASGGASAKRSVKQHATTLEIKIGDKNQRITGLHSYVIAYTVVGAIERYADHDELFWNAVGSEWSVPIAKVVVRLHSPAAIARVACFAGYYTSRLPCASGVISRTGAGATFQNGFLGANQGVTIVAAMPPNTFAAVGPIRAKHWTLDQAFALRRSTVVPAIVLAVLLIGGIFLLVWQVGRDRRYVGSATDIVFGNPSGASRRVSVFDDHTTPVEYTPPDNLRPGQIGTLVDEVAGPLDVSATIVDLAVRKYLTIEEIPKEHWFGHTDWKLTRLDLNDPLLRYERLLLDALFAGTDGTVLLSSLKTKFHESLVKVEGALYDDAVSRGWFLRRPDKARGFWHAMAVLGLLAGIGLTILLAWRTSFGLLGLPVVAGAIVLSTVSHAMPRRTPKGTGTTHRVLGFRRFIAESERDRAKFAEQKQLFSEYLPYAIVFGVVDRWAKTFEGLADMPETTWYHSTMPFNAVAFSHSINGFATTSVGTMQSTPAGSGGSGFSGGGVGGGGGGGGGGSW